MNEWSQQRESWTPGQYVLVLLAFLAVGVMGLHTIAHGDFWSHLAVGRWVAENGIPRSDTLSFTMQGQRWVNACWLYDRMLYGMWNTVGAKGIILLHMLVVLGTFAALLSISKKWAGGYAVALSVLLGLWLMAARYQVGPHLWALLFTALFMNALAGRYAVWKMALLIVLQVIWVNVDSSFLLGPAVCAVFAVEALRRQAEPSLQKAWPFPILAGLAAGLLVVTLINPYHVRIWSVVSIPVLRQVPAAREWISPFAGMCKGAVLSKSLVTLALVIGAGGLLAERRRLPLAVTTLAVVSAFVVVVLPYHVPVFAVLAMPFLALSLQAIGDAVSDMAHRIVPSVELWGGRMAGALAAVLAVVALVAVFTNAYFVATGSASVFGLAVSHDTGPSSAMDVLEHPAFPPHAFNLPVDGGYLLWRQPGRPVFCDSRLGVYDSALFDLGARCVQGDEAAWKEVAEKWNVNAAVLNCSMPNAAQTARSLLLSRAWKLAFFDGVSAVLVRETEAAAPLLNEVKLREAGLQALEKDRREYARTLGQYRRPGNKPRLIGAGNFYMAMGRYLEAATMYDLLTRGAPEMVGAWLNLGIARLNLGQLKQAQEALEQTVKLAPRNVSGWLYLSEVYARQNDREAEKAAVQRARKLNPAQTRAFLETRGRKQE